MNLQELKTLFLKSLIGCLIASAAIAVVSVLVGEFNEVLSKSLFTILLVAMHCLVSFGFIANNEKQETFGNLYIFTNATFILIVLSFITATFGTWGLFPGDLVAKLYALYFVLLFAILHAEVLAKVRAKQPSQNNLIFTNYAFMAVVVFLLVPVIFAADQEVLSPFYYRLLAALGIVDATLTLIAVIMHKMYLQKHPPAVNQPTIFGATVSGVPQNSQPGTPQAAPPQRSTATNIFIYVLVGYLLLQIGASLFFALLGGLSQTNG